MRTALKVTTLCGALLATVMAVGCGDLVVKVNKKGKSSASTLNDTGSPSVSDKSNTGMTIADVEDFLKDVDDLKKIKDDPATQKKAVTFLIEHWGAIRSTFRNALVDFQDAVVKNAQKTHGTKDALIDAANKLTCQKLEKSDLSILGDKLDLGTLLQGSLLARLNVSSAKLLNPSLPAKLDAITQLILATELGVAADGNSTVTNEGGKTIAKSEIKWKVVDEKDASANAKQAGNRSMSISFTREFDNDKPHSFDLLVRVADGLYEGKTSGNVYYMKLSTLHDETAADGTKKLVVVMENGIEGQDAIYRRQMTFTEDGANKQLYRLEDIVSGANMTTHADWAKVDFNALQKCSIPDSDVEKGGKGGKGGKNPGDDGSIVIPPSEGGNGGDTVDQPSKGDSDDDYDPPSKGGKNPGQNDQTPGQNEKNPSQNDIPSQNQ